MVIWLQVDRYIAQQIGDDNNDDDGYMKNRWQTSRKMMIDDWLVDQW